MYFYNYLRDIFYHYKIDAVDFIERWQAMIEIEAKFKLADGTSRQHVLEIFDDLFTAPVTHKHQIDTVFLLPEQVNAPIIPGSKIMRVRDVLNPKTGGLQKSLLTLKINGEVKLTSEEYEFAVESGETTRQMLEAMGWQSVVTVDKLRSESATEQYNVCVDEVAGLGLFIELEVLADDDTNASEIQSKMHEFLRDLGLEGEFWDTPYDTSIRNLKV